jgi:amino acid transporter
LVSYFRIHITPRFFSHSDIRIATLIVLGGFGLICVFGVNESAGVAAVICGAHLAILAILVVWGFIYGIQDGFHTFNENMHTHFPDVIDSTGEVLGRRSPAAALFFGYCSALLGEC